MEPVTKGKRGRKQEDSTAPNKSRDIQRAFRQRKQTELIALHARIDELEKENLALRLRYEPSSVDSGPPSPEQHQIKEEPIVAVDPEVTPWSFHQTQHSSSVNHQPRPHLPQQHPPSHSISWNLDPLKQQQQLEQHRLSVSILASFAPSPSSTTIYRSDEASHNIYPPPSERRESRMSSSSSGSRNNSFTLPGQANVASPSATAFSYARSDAYHSPVPPPLTRSPLFATATALSPNSCLPLPIYRRPSLRTSSTPAATPMSYFNARAPSPTPSEEEAFLIMACGLPPAHERHLRPNGTSLKDRCGPGGGTIAAVWTGEDDGYARFCAKLMRGLEITGKGASKRESRTTKETQAITEANMTEEERCCGGLLDCEGAIFEDSPEDILPAGYISIETAWRALHRFSSSTIIAFVRDGGEGERRGKYEPEELATKVLENGIVLTSLPSPSYPSSPMSMDTSPEGISHNGGEVVILSNNVRFERTLGLIVIESVVSSVELALETASRRILV